MPHLPPIDRISFWLGFIAATLFWWVVNRFRPIVPVVVQRVKKLIHDIRERDLEGASNFVRKETLRRAQKMHLASSLFALDDILITPRLIAPPPGVDPTAPPRPESIAEQIIPYLPDWPELPSSYSSATLAPIEALQAGSNIAIIGQPGVGKTVCLAHLACQIARRETVAGPLMDCSPFITHVLDLDTSDGANDPLNGIYKSFSGRATVLLQNQIRRLITERFRQGRAVLLVDGLDELHPSDFPPITEYFKRLLEKYPSIHLVLSASPEYLDGLTSLGVVPLGLSSWSITQRNSFLEKWGKAWTATVEQELAKQTTIQPVSPLLINNWLLNERGYPTPLEWTLKVWGSYAGDLSGPTPCEAVDSFISRCLGGPVTRQAVESLACEFVTRGHSTVKYIELDRFLTGMSPSHTGTMAEPVTPQDEEPEKPVGRTEKKGKRDIILSPGEQILETLVRNNILAEHANDTIGFYNPVFAGYLARHQVSQEVISTICKDARWPIYSQTLHYHATVSKDPSWIDAFLYADVSPLYRNLLQASRWLNDVPASAPWRSQIFRLLIGHFQNETLPVGIRARMAAAFSCSGDPSITKLFRQLIGAQTPSTRQLALLGAGAWSDPSLLNDILTLINDPDAEVQFSSCLALSAIQSEGAMNTLVEALYNGNENLRQVAAEALAHDPVEGVEILRDATTHKDILTRRASVFGLLQIREPWTKGVLEKLAVEDGQWVVRNVATQALEMLQTTDPHIPRPLPLPWDSPWLIAFAGKKGQGVIPNVPPYELLHMALTTGTMDDQLAAMEYVRTMPEDRFIATVYKLYYSDQPILQEAALYTIWFWGISGVNLPSPTQFGLG
jgi:hypothetical protein